MIHGIKYSANGLLTRYRALQLAANNLANLSSVGFKRSLDSHLSLRPETHRDEPLPEEFIDFSQGALKETGNPLDLAIDGEGFFVVQGQEGTLLTRQGNFKLNDEGFLVTADGRPILGEAGPIILQGDVEIRQDGTILQDGKVIDRIALMDVEDRSQLRRVGGGYFELPQGARLKEAVSATLHAGFLEESNVNAMEEMVNLIEIYREFEANQRSLKTQDGTLEKAVNEVARV